ncbi:MAG: N-acetyltransferase [Sphingobacteriaceae bacterium]|nr:MAG: N-acetyltransferase [Sphingobacteriaceae bacterium]
MIAILQKSPEIEVYQHLRVACGLSAKLDEAVQIGLSATLFAVMALDENKPIGMGRVVGDGGCFCQVVDICVLPEYQGQGIGKRIMQNISAYLDQLPESCYISLLADGKADQLYAQFGFKDTLPNAKGMFIKK